MTFLHYCHHHRLPESILVTSERASKRCSMTKEILTIRAMGGIQAVKEVHMTSRDDTIGRRNSTSPLEENEWFFASVSMAAGFTGGLLVLPILQRVGRWPCFCVAIVTCILVPPGHLKRVMPMLLIGGVVLDLFVAVAQSKLLPPLPDSAPIFEPRGEIVGGLDEQQLTIEQEEEHRYGMEQGSGT